MNARLFEHSWATSGYVLARSEGRCEECGSRRNSSPLAVMRNSRFGYYTTIG